MMFGTSSNCHLFLIVFIRDVFNSKTFNLPRSNLRLSTIEKIKIYTYMFCYKVLKLK